MSAAVTTKKPASRAKATAKSLEAPAPPAMSVAEQDERNFVVGRDIALAMLREAEKYEFSGEATAKRRYRDGKAQNRFAQQYLQRLVDNPEGLAGFSAVLSAALTHEILLSPEAWNLPMAEFEAGEIGADGTEAVPPPECSASTVPPAAQGSAEPAPASEPVPEADAQSVAWGGYLHATHAEAIFREIVDGLNSGVADGAYTLIMSARDAVDRAYQNPHESLVLDASNRLNEAIDVLEMFTATEFEASKPIIAAEGVLSLLKMSKSEIERCGEMLP